ncbi:hypothetical protein NCC49_000677 [Naganishia albida]|nr:hypothetical protein NCC49_000677 [Naganishia albida]
MAPKAVPLGRSQSDSFGLLFKPRSTSPQKPSVSHGQEGGTSQVERPRPSSQNASTSHQPADWAAGASEILEHMYQSSGMQKITVGSKDDTSGRTRQMMLAPPGAAHTRGPPAASGSYTPTQGSPSSAAPKAKKAKMKKVTTSLVEAHPSATAGRSRKDVTRFEGGLASVVEEPDTKIDLGLPDLTPELMIFHDPMLPYAGKVAWAPVPYAEAVRMQDTYKKTSTTLDHITNLHTGSIAAQANPSLIEGFRTDLQEAWDTTVADYLLYSPPVAASSSTAPVQQSVELASSKIYAVLGDTAMYKIEKIYRATARHASNQYAEPNPFLASLASSNLVPRLIAKGMTIERVVERQPHPMFAHFRHEQSSELTGAVNELSVELAVAFLAGDIPLDKLTMDDWRWHYENVRKWLLPLLQKEATFKDVPDFNAIARKKTFQLKLENNSERDRYSLQEVVFHFALQKLKDGALPEEIANAYEVARGFKRENESPFLQLESLLSLSETELSCWETLTTVQKEMRRHSELEGTPRQNLLPPVTVNSGDYLGQDWHRLTGQRDSTIKADEDESENKAPYATALRAWDDALLQGIEPSVQSMLTAEQRSQMKQAALSLTSAAKKKFEIEQVEVPLESPSETKSGAASFNTDVGFGTMSRAKLNHGVRTKHFWVAKASVKASAPDVEQMAVKFADIVEKQTALEKSDSMKLYAEKAEELKSRKQVDLPSVTEEVIDSFKSGVEAAKLHRGEQQAVAETVTESRNASSTIQSHLTYDEIVEVVTDGVWKASYKLSLVTGKKSHHVGWDWGSVASLLMRIAHICQAKVDAGEITAEARDELLLLTCHVLLLAVTQSPGRASLYMECKLGKIFESAKRRSEDKLDDRFWRALRSDLIGICMIAGTRAASQFKLGSYVTQAWKKNNKSLLLDPQWYIYLINQQLGRCGVPGCQRCLLYHPDQKKIARSVLWARYCSIQTVIARGNIQLVEGQPGFASFECLVTAFSSAFHPQIATMFFRYCRVIHGDERKQSGKERNYYAIVTSRSILDEHDQVVEDGEDSVGFPLLLEEDAEGGEADGGDDEPMDAFEDADRHASNSGTQAGSQAANLVKDSGRGKRGPDDEWDRAEGSKRTRT